MMDLEQRIRAELSEDRAYDHMTRLIDEVGERVSGSRELERAAVYIRDELGNYGFEARIDDFYMYNSSPGSAGLRIVQPETRVIAAKPACHIASTLPEGFEAELVYLNAGGYDDYEGVDVTGKVVLTSMDLAPRRPEKARIAYEKGARGLIIMNWGPAEDPNIQMGAIKSQWGNPTPESFATIPQLPVLSVTRAAGEHLAELCGAGPVRIWFHAESSREWVRANQPTGVLKGRERPDEFVLVGGHLDAWGKTAICNSSGNSLMLELARVLAQHRSELRRSVVFAFWDGHEVAEAAGSTWYVDNHWDELSRSCVAYVNIDNAGILGSRIPSAIGVSELRSLLEEVAHEQWQQRGDWVDIYKGGDASFFGVGVPYGGFYTRYDEAKLKEYNNAFLGPWLHSDADTADKIDRDLHQKHLEYFASLIVRLCNAEVFPYDIDAPLRTLLDDLRSLATLSPADARVDFTTLIERAERLRSAARDLMAHADRLGHEAGWDGGSHREQAVEWINRALTTVTRELSPILRSAADRYSQDPYGYTLVGKPIPRLFGPISRLLTVGAGSDEFKLWQTKLVKERNSVADGIGRSLDITNMVLELLKARTAAREVVAGGGSA